MGTTHVISNNGYIEGLRDSHVASQKARHRDIIQLALALGDMAVFTLALLGAFLVRFYSGIVDWLPAIFVTDSVSTAHPQIYLPHFVAGAVLFLVLAVYFRLSSLRYALVPQFALRRIFRVCIVWAVAYLLFALFFRVDPAISRIFVVLGALLGAAGLFLWRLLFAKSLVAMAADAVLKKRILVLGWSRDTGRMWLRFVRESNPSIEFVGVISLDGVGFRENPPEKLPILGTESDLPSLIVETAPDAVLLADLEAGAEKATDLVNLCHKQLVGFIAIPSFFEVLTSGVRQESLLGVPTMTIDKLPLDHVINRLLKRAVDILGGIVGLALSAPIMLVFFVIVWLESRGPVIYAQTRTGRHGKPFRIYKIRSMKLNAESGTGAVWARENDDRRLRVGAFMRAWNIDELPQFWNILKGDMSLVGPRPERPELISEFQHNIAYYNLRLSVKPGLTGWAAVNGLRGDTDLIERIRFDIDYIERWSPLFDFYVMLLTFKKNENAY